MRRLASVMAMAVAVLGVVAPGSRAAAAPRAHPAASVPMLSHAGRWITDPQGRVVVLHGMNLVAKTTASDFAPAGLGFDSADAAFLAAEGFNVVRLGVIYQALEPEPGVFDDAYLNSIVSTQRLLARYGIYSLVDMHDDDWGPAYSGEGFPLWATPSGDQDHAWDSFWANTAGPGGTGLQDYYAAMVRHVAQRFAGLPYVLGYDVINEPQPGSLSDECANPVACPLDGALTSFYERVIPQIRAADPHHLIWVEPNLDYDAGGAENLPSLGDPEIGFSFHDYCLLNAASGGTEDNSTVCPTDERLVMSNAEAQSSRTGMALMMTEFGSTPLTGLITRVADEADADELSWTEWTLTTNGTTDFASTPSLIDNEHLPPTGSNINAAQEHVLVRAYPQLIAGTPTSWSYDPDAHTFKLAYSTARAAGGGSFPAGSVTRVELPPLDYPDGYGVTVKGASVVSSAHSTLLLLASNPSARSVTVTVTPGQRGHFPRVHVARVAWRVRVRGQGGSHAIRVLGALTLPSGVLPAYGCAGRVPVEAVRGGRAVARVRARVTRRCTFATTLRLRGRGRVALRVRFGGNQVLLPTRTRARRVTV
jgi:endoglycosylceramidase